MPTTIEITAYKYEELDGRAKENARQRVAKYNTDHDWYSDVYEDFAERCEAAGFLYPKFQFSGFCSQGDGASFSCEFAFAGDDCKPFLSAKDWEDYVALRAEFRLAGATTTPTLELAGRIATRGRSSHEYSMSLEDETSVLDPVIVGESFDNLSDKAAEFETRDSINDAFNNILEAARALARKLYSALEKEYEWLTSDERIQETCTANEWLFDEDGRML
jgi:hypothetical protein